ncbi:hypothetical protein BDA99DRAFT_262582 [Phascolomyces articulosus]|uniref:Uncharacterized protein n=1 Tax=Phascolomyces articulosus TaxID=60185 RepID=A0AAD5K1E8_9FUNG|nr:hypothetical protein BDA99DRAFT_262582 [Phascolomyces articulosus]
MAVAMNPDSYATERNAYLRITTHVLIYGNLLQSIRPLIEFSEPLLVSDALDIITNIIRCQPPYDLAPSSLHQYQQPVFAKPVIMSGLFGGGSGGNSSSYSGSTTTRQEDEKKDHLDRDLILDLIVQDILSIPFFVDTLTPTLSEQYMKELPFEAVLTSVIRLNSRQVWAHQDERVANLLMNITQLAKIQPDIYLERALELYAKSIQSLLSNISTSYFAEPKRMQPIQQDSDLSDESEEESNIQNQVTIIAEAPRQVDPRIKERLESLYDTQHIDILVRHFINLVATTTATTTTESSLNIQQISSDMACLFDALIIQWPSKKDALLNTLLYHRWWSDTSKTQPIHLAQFFWKAWSNHPFAGIFDDDDGIVSHLPDALRAHW